MRLHLRPLTTRVLALSATVLMTMTACSTGEDPVADTPVGAATPDGETAAEPSSDEAAPTLDVPTLPSLPTDFPTDLPTGLPDIDLGECEAIYGALTDATDAIEGIAADPASATDLLGEIAQALRGAAAESSPDVAAAAEELAVVYDEFAASLDGGDVPDFTRLTEAVTALTEACVG